MLFREGKSSSPTVEKWAFPQQKSLKASIQGQQGCKKGIRMAKPIGSVLGRITSERNSDGE